MTDKKSVVFCEAVAIYGVIMAIIMCERVQSPHNEMYTNQEIYDQTMYSGIAFFWTGVAVGISNLACG